MDLGTILTTVAVSVVIQTVVIVWLYQSYIIPQIVARVRDELFEKIEVWINETKNDMNESIKVSIGEGIDGILGFLRGKRGNDGRQFKNAEKFLTANLPSDDPDFSGDLAQSIITDAVMKYGKTVVETVLRSMKPAEPQQEPAAAVW